MQSGKAQNQIAAQVLGGRLHGGAKQQERQSLLRLAVQPVGAAQQIERTGAEAVQVKRFGESIHGPREIAFRVGRKYGELFAFREVG